MATEILVTHVSGKVARPPVRFSKECVKLGRLHDNDVYFDEYAKKLSRYHAAVFIADGTLYLKDMGSKNGTYVNGVRLADEHRTIEPVDLVKLGDYGPVLRFELLGVPREKAPAAAATPPALDDSAPTPFVSSAQAAAPKPVPPTIDVPPPRRAPDPAPAGDAARKALGKSTLLALEDVISQERLRTQRMLIVASLAGAIALALLAVGGIFLHARSMEELRDTHRRESDEMKAHYESDLKKQVEDLARAIEERDRKLTDIREQQGLSDAQRTAMLEATQKELADLRSKLAKQERALERKGDDPQKQGAQGWPEIVDRYRESLFLCYGGTAEKGGIGTAFVVGPDVLASNAHVVQLLRDSPERYVIQNQTGAVLKVKDFRTHPDFKGVPQSADVGLLRVDTGGHPLVPLPLATDDDLRRLRIGTQLGTLGYPGELAQGYFASFDKATGHFKGVLATFKDGWIGRMTNYRAEADSFQGNTLIQHSASLTGGTSGSPMFTQDGKVVALNNASYDYEIFVQQKQGQKKGEVKREKSGAELAWAIRVDELRRLKEQAGW